MKRSIPKSLLSKAEPAPETKSVQSPAERLKGVKMVPHKMPNLDTSKAGSAWKSGALAQSKALIEQNREELIEDILQGRRELELDPGQLYDPLKSDRREDWKEQQSFLDLVDSIEANGQDTPVLVWPASADWRPDPYNPFDVRGVRFHILTGRRRRAAAIKLDRKLRAILAPPGERKGPQARFEMLFMRFRENEARENLGAFERLLSVGEMYETLAKDPDTKLTAAAFAKRIGVHESIVSRARAAFKARDDILNAFKNAYDMSFAELQKAMASLKEAPATRQKTVSKPVEITRKIGKRKLSVATRNGALAVKAAGMALDKDTLEKLGDVIAAFLTTELEAEQQKRS